MKSLLSSTVLALATLAPASVPAVAQTPDWTFDVPVEVTNLDPEVRYVVVTCIVGPEIPDGLYWFARAFMGEMGGAISEYEAVPTPPSAVGAVAVEPDAARSVRTQVTVPVFATPAMTTAQKLEATTWSCGLALSNETNPIYRLAPDATNEYSWSHPAPGAAFTPVVSGTFN